MAWCSNSSSARFVSSPVHEDWALVVKWGIAFSSTGFPDPDAAVAQATAAEQSGFESLWAPEHVVMSRARVSPAAQFIAGTTLMVDGGHQYLR